MYDDAARSEDLPRERRRAVLVVAAGILAAAGTGALIGHETWGGTPGASTSALAPANPSGSSGSSSGLGGNLGGGDVGNSGLGGSTRPGVGIGNSGSGPPSFGNAGPGASSSAADSIANGVDAALVDINTELPSGAAAGTGMVLTSSGEVLTNNHVIDGATSISATDLGNGKTYTARVVGYDRTADVAVLQLKGASGLQTVTLGNSSALSTGEEVVGIGNAGGAGGTPSSVTGTITGLNQSITASDESDGTSERLTGLIATNAAIEAGDSGGPLVDTRGQVIGMDTAGSSTNGGFRFSQTTTAGFAVPIDTANSIARQIEAHKGSSTVHIGATAFLGIELSPVSQFGGFGFGPNSGGTTPTSGVLIAGAVAGSPAARAGLGSGDTITALNGHAVTSTSTLTNLIAAESPGRTASLVYVDAAGTRHAVSVTFISGPAK